MCYLSWEDLPTTLKKYWPFDKQDKFQDYESHDAHFMNNI